MSANFAMGGVEWAFWRVNFVNGSAIISLLLVRKGLRLSQAACYQGERVWLSIEAVSWRASGGDAFWRVPAVLNAV